MGLKSAEQNASQFDMYREPRFSRNHKINIVENNPKYPYVTLEGFGRVYTGDHLIDGGHVPLHPEVVRNTIVFNDYLVAQTGYFDPYRVARYKDTGLGFIAIDGGPASGKHSIQNAVHQILNKDGFNIVPDDLVYALSLAQNDPDIKAADVRCFTPDQLAKYILARKKANGSTSGKIFTVENGEFARITHGGFLQEVMKQEKGWIVTRRGTVSAFQLLYQPQIISEITRVLHEYDYFKKVQESASIRDVSSLFVGDIEMYNHALVILSNAHRLDRQQNNLPELLFTTPIPLTFFCGLPIEHQIDNLKNAPVAARKGSPRLRSQWTEDELVSIRFMQAVLLHTSPMFQEINTTPMSDFDTNGVIRTAQEVIEIASELFTIRDTSIPIPNL